MDSEGRPVDRDGEITRALEVSALRDEIEVIERRMNSTVASGLVITVLFVVSGAFMQQTGTLWFLGALWLFFTARLGLINRTSGRELKYMRAELELLTKPPGDTSLSAEPHVASLASPRSRDG